METNSNNQVAVFIMFYCFALQQVVITFHVFFTLPISTIYMIRQCYFFSKILAS